jgi:zinc protease
VSCAAGDRDRVELARFLDRYGANLSADVAPESMEITLWGPSSAFDRLFPVLADCVLRPRFSADDIERIRRQLRERQMRERTQPDARAETELFRILYPPGHPYRSTGVGTPESARRVSAPALRKFHETHFSGGGGRLVVTSAQSLDALARRAQSLFATFPVSAAPALPIRDRPNGGANPEPRLVPMPERSQVEIRVGGRSLARADPRFTSLFLANEILGGRPLLARLFQRVRERHGLAYHASSDVESMRFGGYWQAEAGSGPKDARRVARLIRAEVARLAHSLVSASELNRIRESSIGSLPLQLETTSGAHELALDVAYHDLPLDFYRTWPAQLRALGPRDIQRAARAGLDPENAVTVLAGPVPT